MYYILLLNFVLLNWEIFVFAFFIFLFSLSLCPIDLEDLEDCSLVYLLDSYRISHIVIPRCNSHSHVSPTSVFHSIRYHQNSFRLLHAFRNTISSFSFFRWVHFLAPTFDLEYFICHNYTRR